MGLRRTSDFILFYFKKGENVILFLRSNVSKEQNKKSKHVVTTMSSAICDSLFLRPKTCKRINKRQKLHT